MNQIIERATFVDSDELSELTYRSKAYWGYSEEQMEKWRDDLHITEEYIQNHEVFLLRKNNQIVGYYSFIMISPSTIKLDNLFIDPKNIGKGLGRTLMNDFLSLVNNSDVSIITLESEPQVEQFYQKFGFKTVSQLKSSILNRFLPIMELKLNT
ncbi:MAG: GNAT family N-acetyltransferase [Flammeovirgaceae bacterium]|nr:GNAT family N-acetyltransferase [Flammeovirgaceae bacterium]MBE61123.1 GNAT family N-acetyltransferase [Flammeovirgaceae bacterium]MBR08277.1 GNAT family N-acetyltransferase [Rickettsiales bacterium]HCX21578.1 GNAT family N-acetyltransferase [Cytophagales bacterium]|tara:strand:+ start:3499 stop:3960 length:462 start_codon:yes stop_codon:yes gene_type:complete